jgi:hypothetical protein
VAFTGRLGTADSQLGNIELGSVGSGGDHHPDDPTAGQYPGDPDADDPTPGQHSRDETQSMQMRARIGNLQSPGHAGEHPGGQTQSLQLRANVLGCLNPEHADAGADPGTMRSLQMRAYLRACSRCRCGPTS